MMTYISLLNSSPSLPIVSYLPSLLNFLFQKYLDNSCVSFCSHTCCYGPGLSQPHPTIHILISLLASGFSHPNLSYELCFRLILLCSTLPFAPLYLKLNDGLAFACMVNIQISQTATQVFSPLSLPTFLSFIIYTLFHRY